ncbi:magnesium transporter [Tropicimonas sp. TH_r6]|uniref:magnesium transporter n=1 Tax=Tropicimonas sp. TH_r6 TaxID=3082085 RepID=UPI0029530CB1|nr:magnesium transporter [Tropicimonas sp. TH_r6]MDV7144613.1 magnesium transporter [Tropicimonas sp. TH_r6]
MNETGVFPGWMSGDSEEAALANKAVTRRIEKLIKAEEQRKVLAIIRHWSPSDILSLFVQMRSRYARRLLEWMPDEAGIKVLAELDPRLHAVLAEEETRSTFRKLIEGMEPDEAFPILDELPHDFALEILAGHPHEAALRAALDIDEDHAAAHMKRGVMTARIDGTVGDVIAEIRANARDIERLERVYVVDEHRRVRGEVRRRDLLMHADDTCVADIMGGDAVVVAADADQEDVLQLARERRIQSIGVVDAQGRLVGLITQDELRQIASEEVEEDILLMGGVHPDATEFDGPLKIVARRLPWILGGLVGASIAASVIGSYEEALTQAAILASFIPVVMATAGNVGIQASTMSIQALGPGVTWRGDFLPRLGRELLASLVNGAVVGSAVALLVLLATRFVEIENAANLSLTCLISMTLVTIIAASFGALIPFALKALKLDPAVATGIFITTANDVFGVLIFFTVASILYL